MLKYEKPVVLKNEDLSEGVYMASGCYTTTASIRQDHQTGRTDYRIQVNAKHDGDHTTDEQTLTIVFNQDVVYKWSNGTVVGSGTGTTIVIKTYYHQNPKDNVGLGDVVVESEQGLAIVSISMTD